MREEYDRWELDEDDFSVKLTLNGGLVRWISIANLIKQAGYEYVGDE